MLITAGAIYAGLTLFFAHGLRELEWRGRAISPVPWYARLGVGFCWPVILIQAARGHGKVNR